MPPSSYFEAKSYQSTASGTISPTTDAIGCSLPSTLHSTSTPATNSSTSTFVVVARRRARRGLELFRGSSDRDPDARPEPGRLDDDRVAERVDRAVQLAPERHAPRHRDAVVAHDRLEQVLVHRHREAATPGPTYGTPASSSRPCTVPSSPNGPCSTGKTTSIAPKSAGPAVVEGIGTDADAASGRRAPPAPRRPPGRQRPRSVAADLDRNGVVACLREAREDRRAGGERDLVLARAAAHQDGDAQAVLTGALAQPSPIGKRATKIVTVDPGSTSAPSGGSWSMTMPSSSGFEGRDVLGHDRRIPRRSASAAALPSSRPMTPGTDATGGGPWETSISTVLPLFDRPSGVGALGDDEPGRLVALDDDDARLEPRGPELRLGAVLGLLENVGHGRRSRFRCETRIVTGEPLATVSPGFGSWRDDDARLDPLGERPPRPALRDPRRSGSESRFVDRQAGHLGHLHLLDAGRDDDRHRPRPWRSAFRLGDPAR